MGHQRLDGVPHRADERDVDRDAPADVLAADVDLDDLRVVGVERAIREIGPEHEQRVAVLHRAVPRGESEQPRHPHVEGIVVLDELLATHRVDDRRLERTGDGHEVVVRPLAPRAGEDRDPRGVSQVQPVALGGNDAAGQDEKRSDVGQRLGRKRNARAAGR